MLLLILLLFYPNSVRLRRIFLFGVDIGSTVTFYFSFSLVNIVLTKCCSLEFLTSVSYRFLSWYLLYFILAASSFANLALDIASFAFVLLSDSVSELMVLSDPASTRIVFIIILFDKEQDNLFSWNKKATGMQLSWSDRKPNKDNDQNSKHKRQKWKESLERAASVLAKPKKAKHGNVRIVNSVGTIPPTNNALDVAKLITPNNPVHPDKQPSNYDNIMVKAQSASRIVANVI